jgi:hypothetical protein
MSPAPSRSYVGVSEIDCGENVRNADFADDKLEMYNDPAAPLHTLVLKEGDIVMLTRNIDKNSGLVANVRVRIVQLRDHTVEVALHGDDDAAPPKRFNVCRWRTLFKMSHDSDILIARTQFPFRLAYALTFNKAQGQTLHRVLVDLTSNQGTAAAGDKDLHGGAFAHGHLYVALSRVERSTNIAVFVDDARAEVVSAAHIVHTSLLYDDTSSSNGAQTSSVRRAAIQSLRPGTRIGARHLRPAGYQGPIRHLYDTVTRDPRRPRFLAHEPHALIGTHAALLARLRVRQSNSDRPLANGAYAAQKQPHQRPEPATVLPRRSLPIASFANLRAVLGRAGQQPPRTETALPDYIQDNHICTFAELRSRLLKRHPSTADTQQPSTAKRGRSNNAVRRHGVDVHEEHEEE